MRDIMEEADVLIVTVNRIEARAVLEGFAKVTANRAQVSSRHGCTYSNLGLVNNQGVAMVQSEMGSGSLGASLQTVREAIGVIKPSCVFMVGVAFGMKPNDQKIGDILVSKQILCYEPQRVEAYEDQVKLIPRGARVNASTRLLRHLRTVEAHRGVTTPRIDFGLILSGEKLIDNRKFLDQLKRMEPEALGGEMEGAGLYASCHESKVDWILVKAICDWADGHIRRSKAKNQQLAAANAVAFIAEALQKGTLATVKGGTRPGSLISRNSEDMPKVTIMIKGNVASFGAREQDAWILTIARMAKVDETDVQLVLISGGSIKLVFRISQSGADRLKKLWDAQDQELLSLGILNLDIENAEFETQDVDKSGAPSNGEQDSANAGVPKLERGETGQWRQLKSLNPFRSNAPLNPRHNESILIRKEKIEEVISGIVAGNYCLILGPKYSGRTSLLLAVKAGLQGKPGNIPVLVHPRNLNLAGDKGFFESLAHFIEKALRHEKAWPTSLTLKQYRFHENPDVFNNFLEDVLQELGQKLVILFDSIERIPPELLTRLGWIAHACYEEREAKLSYKHISFNFAGAISLRYLTYHMNPKVSPLRICHTVILKDLSTTEARTFLETINDEYDLGFTTDGIAEILHYVGGDINLLQRVSGLALDAAGKSGVGRQAVAKAVDGLLSHTEESLAYAVKRAESDRQMFDLILKLLQRDRCLFEPSEIESELYDRFGITHQEMAGTLVLERMEGYPTQWAFRNKLTELFLQRHLTPQRIVQVYTEHLDFQAAVTHCDPLLENVRNEFETDIEHFRDRELRQVLTAFIGRIQAESSHEFAYELMAKLLAQGFGCTVVTFYDYVSPEHKLVAVTFLKPLFHNDGSEIDVNRSDGKNIEVEAYRSQLFANKDEGDELHIAIPLKNLIGEVTAVITVHTQSRGNVWSRLDLKVQVMERALNAINKALNQVEDKRKKHIISSVSQLRRAKAKMPIFVAHEFNEELLKNLRDHLGRVSQELEFRYVDQTNTGGLLFAAIMNEIKSSQLGLYEMSTVNNNVCFECGVGIGLNLPGIPFIRTAKRSSKATLARMPELLKGLLPFTYHDYTGIMENINAKLDRILESYLDHRSDPSFVHFLGLRMPDRGKRQRYAAVLDHDQFGDQRDYRKTVQRILDEAGLKAVYPLDQQASIDQYLTEPSTGNTSSRLIDVMCLLQHADLVIGRVEDVKTPRVAQIFVALGYCVGLNEISEAKTIRIQLTLLQKSPTGSPLDVPSDIRGWNKYFSYSNFEEIGAILKDRLASSSPEK